MIVDSLKGPIVCFGAQQKEVSNTVVYRKGSAINELNICFCSEYSTLTLPFKNYQTNKTF